MEIVFPLVNLAMSGGLRVTLQHASGLAQRGHRVTVVFPADARRDYFDLPSNLELIPVEIGRNRRSVGGYFATVMALGESIPPCDVVLANSWQAVYPALISRRHHPQNRIVHLLQHLDSVINSGRPWPIRLRNRLMFEYVYRLPIQKIVVSSWLQGALYQGYRQASSCVPNGVDCADFTGGVTPRWKPPTEGYDILCLARAVAWKGFRDAVAGVRSVAVGDPSVRLVVVTRDQIVLPTDIRCLLVRPENDAEIGKLYQSCSVFVFPSWLEGFGLPALEAMSCGVPVVTTECGGVAEFARDGENCLVVPARQPEELAAAIKRLRRDSRLAQRLATKGIETAREFSADKAVDKLERVLLRWSPTRRQ